MNHGTKLTVILGVFLALLALDSCSKSKDLAVTPNGENPELGQSHNSGTDCMTCHCTDTSGIPLWTVAGTTYNSTGMKLYAGAKIYLYDQPHGQGNLIATMTSDACGNFYSETPVDFSQELFPVARTKIGEVAMPMGVKMGSCNSCHGIDSPLLVVL